MALQTLFSLARPTATPSKIPSIKAPLVAAMVLPLFSIASPLNAQTLNAYYPQWGIYDRFYPKNLVSNGTAPLISNLIYAFASIKNAVCAIGDPQADYQMAYSADNSIDGNADPSDASLKGNFHQLQLLKQSNPSLKVLISIGGAAAGTSNFHIVAQPSNRQAFVASCIDMFITGNFAPGVQAPGIFDGIDIDWEFPTAADKPNFTGLLADFRSQLDAAMPGLMLTIASPAGASDYQNIDLGVISQYIDLCNVMTYAYEGPWNSITGLVAPLYHAPGDPYSANIDSTVQDYLAAGFPNNKMLMGMYFYGYDWTLVFPMHNMDYSSPGHQIIPVKTTRMRIFPGSQATWVTARTRHKHLGDMTDQRFGRMMMMSLCSSRSTT